MNYIWMGSLLCIGWKITEFVWRFLTVFYVVMRNRLKGAKNDKN